MSIVLPALAVAFGAFSVWLAVRIVNRRERWAKWLAVVLAFTSALLTIWWLSRPQEGIIFDSIDNMPTDIPNGQ
jgi:uncharacterized membrane protein